MCWRIVLCISLLAGRAAAQSDSVATPHMLGWDIMELGTGMLQPRQYQSKLGFVPRPCYTLGYLGLRSLGHSRLHLRYGTHVQWRRFVLRGTQAADNGSILRELEVEENNRAFYWGLTAGLAYVWQPGPPRLLIGLEAGTAVNLKLDSKSTWHTSIYETDNATGLRQQILSDNKTQGTTKQRSDLQLYLGATLLYRLDNSLSLYLNLRAQPSVLGTPVESAGLRPKVTEGKVWLNMYMVSTGLAFTIFPTQED